MHTGQLTVAGVCFIFRKALKRVLWQAEVQKKEKEEEEAMEEAVEKEEEIEKKWTSDQDCAMSARLFI